MTKLRAEFLLSGLGIKEFAEKENLSPAEISRLAALKGAGAEEGIPQEAAAEYEETVIEELPDGSFQLAPLPDRAESAIINDVPIINKLYESARKLIAEVDLRLEEGGCTAGQLRQYSSIIVEMMKLLREYHNTPTPYEALSMELAKKRVSIEERRLRLEEQRTDTHGGGAADIRFIFDVPEDFRN